MSSTISILGGTRICADVHDNVPDCDCASDLARDEAARIRVDRAIEHLQSSSHSLEGLFGNRDDVGVTALVTTAILRSGQDIHSPSVIKSLKYLKESVQPDGGIYTPGRQLGETTKAAWQRCVSARPTPTIATTASSAMQRLLSKRASGMRTGENASPMWSMAGRATANSGGPIFSTRLSCSTQSHPVMSVPAILPSRRRWCSCRAARMRKAGNATPPVSDGGFHYTCAAGSSEPTDVLPDGSLRSSGVMTYSGLQSLLLAGVTSNDCRVKAALEWIRKRHDFTSNPGMGNAGLYHYYHAARKR